MFELFPAVPEDLAAVESDELRGLLDTFRSVGIAVRANEADLGDLTPEQVKEQLRAAVENKKAIETELAAREEAETNYVTDITELTAELGVEDEPEEAGETEGAPAVLEAEGGESLAAESGGEGEDGEGGGEGDGDGDGEGDGAGDGEDESAGGEAVAAAAAVPVETPQRRLAIPKGPSRFHARPKEATGPAFTASAGLEGVREGVPLDRLALAKAVISKRERMTATAAGNAEDVVIASVDYRDIFGEERTLYGDPSDGEKLNSVIENMDALVAAGGWCAPGTPLYDIVGLSTASRPVRDSLPGMLAARGSVRHTPGFSISAIIEDQGVGVVTAAEDAQGGTFGAKSCQVIDCPEIVDTELYAIYKCLQFGNMSSRAWPEMVAAFNDEAMAQQARVAERELLDAMALLSLNLTGGAIYGASSTLLYRLQISRAGMISRLRMEPTQRVQAWIPFWVAEMFSADLVNSQFGRFDTPPEQVGALLSRFGIDVTWYLDSATGAGQVWADEVTGGAQDDWPGTTADIFVAVPGTFLFLDNGVLDLGIVRDSTLNLDNSYQIFSESFEALIRLGPEQAAHRIALTICPDGRVAAPETTEITCA